MHFPVMDVTTSAAETETLARQVGEGLIGGELLQFRGDLGSGKTTFVRGMARGLGIHDPTGVSSPSYTLINDYPGNIRLLHVDLYRLSSPEDIEDLGLAEMLDDNTVMAIEWSERIPASYLQATHLITMRYIDVHRREIRIDSIGS